MDNINGNLEESVNKEAEKKPFNEPKLKFIEPQLIKQGDATKITAGFFGSFYP